MMQRVSKETNFSMPHNHCQPLVVSSAPLICKSHTAEAFEPNQSFNTQNFSLYPTKPNLIYQS